MNKKILITIIFFLVMLIGVIAATQLHKTSAGDRYVRGKYGAHCYNEADPNGSIKYKVYFKTIEDCLKSLQ